MVAAPCSQWIACSPVRRCTVAGRSTRSLGSSMIIAPRIIAKLIVAIAFVITSQAAAEEKPYSVRSKDVGWDSIDLTIAEIRRDGRVSVLRIPRYEKRSAIESRFAMCAFTDIAIQRDFEVWIVSDGSITDDMVRVGFLKSETEDAAKLLGPEFVGPNALRTSVQVINRMCGISRAK
jgi:hypothetical protein